MKESSLNKIEKVKNLLNEKGYFFEELANGHIKIDKVNLWCTSEKWYCPLTGEKGLGINSFIKFIENK